MCSHHLDDSEFSLWLNSSTVRCIAEIEIAFQQTNNCISIIMNFRD